MTNYPSLTGKELITLLKKAGFFKERQKGSHVIFKHPDGRTTVIPVHTGETIGPGLFSKILRDIELTKDDLLRLQ